MKTWPKLRTKGITVWAVVNPKSGQTILQTICLRKIDTELKRDRFFHGCPIYQCWLSPLFLDEVKKNPKEVGRV